MMRREQEQARQSLRAEEDAPAVGGIVTMGPRGRSRSPGWRRPYCGLGILAAFFMAWPLLAAEHKFKDVSALLPPSTNHVPENPGGTNTVTSAGAANSMDPLDDKYKLAIGDHLSFRIVEDEEDPKPLFVTDSGDLELPYIGRFPAAGKTCKRLAHEIKAELEKEYYYQATVIIAVDIMAKSRGKVYLVGPVHLPGPQDIPSDEVFTVSKAILRAGGFGDFADRHNVRITRKTSAGEESHTVDVGEILEKGKTDADLTLEPGDFIYIPERAIRF